MIFFYRNDPEDQNWHSSKIVRRLGPLLVTTASGSQYKLVGDMDVEFAHVEGKEVHHHPGYYLCLMTLN